MNHSNRFQLLNSGETHPRYCAHCGFGFPSLSKTQQVQYRYCPGCRNPVQWGNFQFSNICVDELGVVQADNSNPDFMTPHQPKSKCVQFMARTPGGIVISGTALAALGYGFVVIAIPLATAAAAIMAAGATVVQTAVIGGVLMGIVVAFAGDGKEGEGVLKLTGVVVAAGVAMVATGVVAAALAGILGFLGPVLIGVGAVAVGAVGCHQLYLQNRKHGWTRKVGAAITGNANGQKNIAGTNNITNAGDPWAGLDKLSLEAGIVEMLRKQNQRS